MVAGSANELAVRAQPTDAVPIARSARVAGGAALHGVDVRRTARPSGGGAPPEAAERTPRARAGTSGYLPHSSVVCSGYLVLDSERMVRIARRVWSASVEGVVVPPDQRGESLEALGASLSSRIRRPDVRPQVPLVAAGFRVEALRASV